jgi:hypothetical protein
MKTVTMALALALLSTSCGGDVARRTILPQGAHVAVPPGTYAAAEEAFAGGAQEAAWTDDRCQEYLDRRDALSAVTAGLGGLTGASGLTAAIPNDMSDEKQKDLQLGLGITTVVLGAATTALTVYTKSLSTRYEQWCNTTQPAPGADGWKPMPMPEEWVEAAEADGGVE